MRSKKLIALAGMLLLIGAGFTLAQNKAQKGETNQVQSQISEQNRIRLRFIDQNGDGINDLFRDHDNDGLPNNQDPDWTRPKDGAGYKTQLGQKNQAGQFDHGQNLREQSWSKTSFRQGLHQFGTGLCDGICPKGKIKRKGGS